MHPQEHFKRGERGVGLLLYRCCVGQPHLATKPEHIHGAALHMHGAMLSFHCCPAYPPLLQTAANKKQWMLKLDTNTHYLCAHMDAYIRKYVYMSLSILNAFIINRPTSPTTFSDILNNIALKKNFQIHILLYLPIMPKPMYTADFTHLSPTIYSYLLYQSTFKEITFS